MDYAVDYAVLAQASQKAQGLGADMSATMRDMRLDDIPAAVPGSMSASAAAHVDAKWVASSGKFAEILLEHAHALEATATEYRRVEDAAHEAAEQFFGSM